MPTGAHPVLRGIRHNAIGSVKIIAVLGGMHRPEFGGVLRLNQIEFARHHVQVSGVRGASAVRDANQNAALFDQLAERLARFRSREDGKREAT